MTVSLFKITETTEDFDVEFYVRNSDAAAVRDMGYRFNTDVREDQDVADALWDTADEMYRVAYVLTDMFTRPRRAQRERQAANSALWAQGWSPASVSLGREMDRVARTASPDALIMVADDGRVMVYGG
jgi:hypothetical protein